MSVVLDLVIKTILYIQCCQFTIASVCVPRKIMDYTVTCLEPTESTNISYCDFILLKSLSPGALEKSSITDQISFLTPPSMSLRQNAPIHVPPSARCRDMGDFHRHYLLYRHTQKCLHNLQPKSGCVLPMHSLLQAKFFCRWPCARGFLSALPENGFYEDHVTLVVILFTLQQSFPYQLLIFQCWGPCDILH